MDEKAWGVITAGATYGHAVETALLDLRREVTAMGTQVDGAYVALDELKVRLNAHIDDGGIPHYHGTLHDRLDALEKRVTEAMHHDYHTKPLTEPDHTCETCKYAWIDSEDCKRCDLLPVDRLPNDPRCRWTPRETPKADRMARYEEAVMDLYQGLAAGDEIELIRVGCGQTQPWSKTQQRFLGPAVKLDAWLKKAE